MEIMKQGMIDCLHYLHNKYQNIWIYLEICNVDMQEFWQSDPKNNNEMLPTKKFIGYLFSTFEQEKESTVDSICIILFEHV